MKNVPCHFVLGDELFYMVHKARDGRTGTRKKVITEEDEALDIVKFYHASPSTGGHSGINTTLAKISVHYTWHGMKQDIMEFVSMQYTLYVFFLIYSTKLL